tara:strand:+ start:172 stop:471 length:300 start_codon:yes stop_codon:yes gene_type:complete
MAQSLEEIRASFDPPTHKVEDGVRIELTAEEVDAMLDKWSANVRNQQLDKEANGYKTDRERAYASIQDQLDMQYWDNVNGTTTWKDHIAQVKADNPKPE